MEAVLKYKNIPEGNYNLLQHLVEEIQAAIEEKCGAILYQMYSMVTLRAIVGNTSHIEIFLLLCKQFVLCMDCQFMK